MAYVSADSITAGQVTNTNPDVNEQSQLALGLCHLFHAHQRSILEKVEAVASSISSGCTVDQQSAIDLMMGQISDSTLAASLCDCGNKDPSHINRKQIEVQVEQIRLAVTGPEQLRQIMQQFNDMQMQTEPEPEQGEGEGEEEGGEDEDNGDKDHMETDMQRAIAASIESSKRHGQSQGSREQASAPISRFLTDAELDEQVRLAKLASMGKPQGPPPTSGSRVRPSRSTRQTAVIAFGFFVPHGLPEPESIRRIIQYAVDHYYSQTGCTDPTRYFEAMVPTDFQDETATRKELLAVLAQAEADTRGHPYSEKSKQISEIVRFCFDQAAQVEGNLFAQNPQTVDLTPNRPDSEEKLLPMKVSDFVEMAHEPEDDDGQKGLYDSEKAYYDENRITNIMDVSTIVPTARVWTLAAGWRFFPLAAADVNQLVYKLEMIAKCLEVHGWPGSEQDSWPEGALNEDWWARHGNATMVNKDGPIRFWVHGGKSELLEDLESLPDPAGANIIAMVVPTTSHFIAVTIAPDLKSASKVGEISVWNSWEDDAIGPFGNKLAQHFAELLNKHPRAMWNQVGWKLSEPDVIKQPDAWACGILATEVVTEVGAGRTPKKPAFTKDPAKELREHIIKCRMGHVSRLWQNCKLQDGKAPAADTTVFPDAPDDEDVSDLKALQDEMAAEAQSSKRDRKIAKDIEANKYVDGAAPGAVVRDTHEDHGVNIDMGWGDEDAEETLEVHEDGDPEPDVHMEGQDD